MRFTRTEKYLSYWFDYNNLDLNPKSLFFYSHSSIYLLIIELNLQLEIKKRK